MSLHSGFFPAYGCRRKQNSPGYHIHLNNQQHHPATSNVVQSARSSIENLNGTDSTTNLPSLVKINVHQNGQRPYRRNDFANNHLFLAKRKLARLFLDQPARPLQATSDLIHLFDTQEPKRRQRIRSKSKRHDVLLHPASSENDLHLSVVNIALKTPYPSAPTRDPLSLMSRQSRSQAIKVSRQTVDATHSALKSQTQSNLIHQTTDNNLDDGLIDHDDVSDTISTMISPLDSSLLLVKSLIPSAPVSSHNHCHVSQHR